MPKLALRTSVVKQAQARAGPGARWYRAWPQLGISAICLPAG